MKRVFLAVAAVLLMAGAAQAQVSGAGPRAGFSVDPDQFVFGGQLQVGPFERNFTFDPSLELGFGDDLTTIQMNFDLNYHFDVGEKWNPYVGFGLGVAFFEWDEDRFGGDGSETEAGANIIGGARFTLDSGSKLGPELRIGIGDIPDLKILGVWNFPM